MALTRKQWNNIIIIATVFMVAVLSFIGDRTQNIPSDAKVLFDDNAPLSQLQLDGIWLQKKASDWECDDRVLNCQQWAKAWQTIRVSPLTVKPEVTGKAQQVLIQIVAIRQSQVWRYFPNEAVLISPANNWYQVPPSLKAELQPIIDAKLN